jgi:hypothetical protein
VNAPISIRDVAMHAGVSVGTAADVPHRPDIVSPPASDGVSTGRPGAPGPAGNAGAPGSPAPGPAGSAR